MPNLLEQLLLRRRTPEQDEALEIAKKSKRLMRPGVMVDAGEGREVSVPQMFLSEPPVVGDVLFQRAAREAQNAIPHGKISKIVQGPGEGSIQKLLRARIDPTLYGDTNLMGTYDPATGTVTINPDIRGEELAETLIHEIGHSRGLSETKARQVGAPFNKTPIGKQ